MEGAGDANELVLEGMDKVIGAMLERFPNVPTHKFPTPSPEPMPHITLWYNWLKPDSTREKASEFVKEFLKKSPIDDATIGNLTIKVFHWDSNPQKKTIVALQQVASKRLEMLHCLLQETHIKEAPSKLFHITRAKVTVEFPTSVQQENLISISSENVSLPSP